MKTHPSSMNPASSQTGTNSDSFFLAARQLTNTAVIEYDAAGAMQGEAPAPAVAEESGFLTEEVNTSMQQAFYRRNLKAFLSRDQNICERVEWVKKHFSHSFSINDDAVITSIYRSASFKNSYESDKWIFKNNFRPPTERNYYASDVVQVQYEMVARKNGFYGYLPSSILRENVLNPETIAIMDDAVLHNRPVRHQFLWHTPNGKSSRRILDDFGLEAISVNQTDEEYDEGERYMDILVQVRPRAENLWRPWEECALPDETCSEEASSVERNKYLTLAL